jgi:hypothetical protein
MPVDGWDNPGLVRAPRSEWVIHDKARGTVHDPRCIANFLMKYIAVEAALLPGEVVAGGFEFLSYVVENDRRALYGRRDAGCASQNRDRGGRSEPADLAVAIDPRCRYIKESLGSLGGKASHVAW